MIIMVPFNWSHARAGRAETQLELCQAGPRLGDGTGKTWERQQTDSKLFSVLCHLVESWSSLPPPPSPERETTTTNKVFVSILRDLLGDENDLFSNKDGETGSFLLVEQSSKYYGNNYTSCHPTARQVS